MVTMKDLLECGVHFGHQTRRWNPKMKKFIFGVRKNIYIIDLQKTLRYFRYTAGVVRDASAQGKTILFVGTKKQASAIIAQQAERCGMPYVNNRWLGGMLTNHKTLRRSILQLEMIEKLKETGEINLFPKKEQLLKERQREKLEKYMGGIRNMKSLPDMMFVLDTIKEKNAVAEARRLGVPIIAPLDTNCDPDLIDYPIPGNDDAIRAIELFCTEIANSVIEGKEIASQDGDIPSPKNLEAVEEELIEETMTIDSAIEEQIDEVVEQEEENL
ncbi:MAG: 30S ribosomal protein S2 [Helicobacteraceae bacterium]|jgi:small subunit ribosomal protein S2|nr:30S ribosomal protein S2 [Helicobacteraceae bacterium]